ncbi:uncharacterized protein LOC134683649 [Mytilus trossulus]|uniref:uncharacterized protein LOC134683649 n=1 Tax=Mytilus trossulus TaxID=6551 RepID=UPI003004EE8C
MQLDLLSKCGSNVIVIAILLLTIKSNFHCRVIKNGQSLGHLKKEIVQRNKRYTLSIPKMHLCQRSFQRCGNGYGGCGGHCPPGRRNVCSRSRGFCISVRMRSG